MRVCPFNYNRPWGRWSWGCAPSITIDRGGGGDEGVPLQLQSTVGVVMGVAIVCPWQGLYTALGARVNELGGERPGGDSAASFMDERATDDPEDADIVD